MGAVRLRSGRRGPVLLSVVVLAAACGGSGDPGPNDLAEENSLAESAVVEDSAAASKSTQDADEVESAVVEDSAAASKSTQDADEVESAVVEDSAVASESTQNVHKAELAIGENEFVTQFVVPVDGYRYENDYGGQYENVADILEQFESEAGIDFFGAFSLHSVVADDESQNTAEVWNGEWEVGYLNIFQLNQAIPAGVDEASSEFVVRLSLGDVPFEAIDQLDVSGTAVFVFENSERPNSRFHYAWLDQGVLCVIDGADREPLERWLAAYLAVPKLAEGETVELAERLVAVSGFRYSNVDLDTITKSEQPASLDMPHSLHFVSNRDGNIGMLAISPATDGSALLEWAQGFADYQETAHIEVHGYSVEVLSGVSGQRSVRAYLWDDGTYAGVLTTNPDAETEVLAFIDAFLEP